MSSGVQKANLVLMSMATTENDKNVSTEVVAATFENEIRSEEVSGEKVWRNYGYFNARKSDYSMEKVNFPENMLLYINQSYLTVKKYKKIFYYNFFTVGQIMESLKMIRPCYDPETEEFKGMYETIGYLVVRGSPEYF